MTKKNTASSTNNGKNNNDTEEQVLDACIFNCTYAQQQLDDEEKGKKMKMKQTNSVMEIDNRIKNDNQKLDVVVSDSMSDGSTSMDDRSLLDYDSSNSWNDEN
mmetsp:Transcript_15624/g.19824  ORF Transcript_15624/g.19824 Transcript_15624/m.19824 type:complete len:103 (-) Transcript_15624:251-559(-)